MKAVRRGPRVHRPRATHDSSCRYIRDGYYRRCLQTHYDCRCHSSRLSILSFSLARARASLPPTSSYTPSSCVPMTNAPSIQSPSTLLVSASFPSIPSGRRGDWILSRRRLIAKFIMSERSNDLVPLLVTIDLKLEHPSLLPGDALTNC